MRANGMTESPADAGLTRAPGSQANLSGPIQTKRMPVEEVAESPAKSGSPDVRITPLSSLTGELEIIAALRRIEGLDALTGEEYRWLATHGTERWLDDQTIVFREGAPAHYMHILLEGEILVRRRNAGAAVTSSLARTGRITGKLPYSRMTSWAAEGCSSGGLWLLDIHDDDFAAMLIAIPSMAQRCVSVLLDRVRDFTRADLQAEKLIALGKLAANLSHELKNPAAAAERAALNLGSVLDEGLQSCELGRLFRSDEELSRYMAWITGALTEAVGNPPSAGQGQGLLSQSDREDVFTIWLEGHSVPNTWMVAPSLARSTLPVSALDQLASVVPPEALARAISRFTDILDARAMIGAIAHSSARIYTIVSAIQDYSYMDQAPIQPIDLNRSIETTLTLLRSRVEGLGLMTNFDSSLPPITGYGAELSQVWTALIENAVDAMGGRGSLKVSTRAAGKMAFVEVCDDGPGVDPAISSLIFEPFFTTKPLGQGLGLGLDLVRRIVGKHFGSVTVESSPGATCFQVRLPLDRPQIY